MTIGNCGEPLNNDNDVLTTVHPGGPGTSTLSMYRVCVAVSLTLEQLGNGGWMPRARSHVFTESTQTNKTNIAVLLSSKRRTKKQHKDLCGGTDTRECYRQTVNEPTKNKKSNMGLSD